jgi:hypothetical protein
VEVQRQHGTREQRDDDAHLAGEQHSAPGLAQPARVERQADLKHEQDQADLAQTVEEPKARGREQRRRDAGQQPSEQRRPQQNAGDDLPDDARLAQLPEAPTQSSSCRADDDDLQEQRAEIGHQLRFAGLPRRAASLVADPS